MRIERLTYNRIKVTLTSADLTRLDIRIEQLTPDSKELHTFLFYIMETIREETDFNPYNGQIVVEATPLSDGISIMISKLEELKRHSERSGRVKISSIRPKIKNSGVQFGIYYFDNFDNLCEALVRLQDEAVMRGRLYRRENDYCVMIKNEKRFERSICVLNEFASGKSDYPMQAEHIMEHWQLVARGKKLAEMAKGIARLQLG